MFSDQDFLKILRALTSTNMAIVNHFRHNETMTKDQFTDIMESYITKEMQEKLHGQSGANDRKK